VKKRIRVTASTEKDQAAKLACSLICENFRMAEKRKIPICQDTGLIVVMLEIGQDVRIVGGDIHAAVQKAVAQGSRESYLRNSVVGDPFERKNTGTNTPAIIHEEIVPGNKVKVIVMPKGGGAENMSFVKMLPPSAGIEGVENEIVDWVKKAGTNPCPPIIVGVGVGGNFEMCAMLAKKALLRQGPSKKAFYRKMEARLLRKINALGIGPQVPQGGRGTALAVHVETAPCHIASLPLAVNINCHVSRYKEYVL
jgi:fumarate hydratase subunit alpha